MAWALKLHILANSGEKALVAHTIKYNWLVKELVHGLIVCSYTEESWFAAVCIIQSNCFLFHTTHEPKLNSFALFIQLAAHKRPVIAGYHKSFALNTIRLIPYHINICSLWICSCSFRPLLWPEPANIFFCWFVDCCWHVLCGSGWLPGRFSKNTPQTCTDRWHSLSVPSHKPTKILLIWLL